MAKPLNYVATARRLAVLAGPNKPRQSDLKRAVSTAYYAVFHALCWNCANCLIGSPASDLSKPAWRQAYRAVEHGFAKGQCKNKHVMQRFPKEIEDFAAQFVTLQEKRHIADYDPFSRFALADVLESIDGAEAAIRKLQKCRKKDLRAFAAWTTLKARTT